MERKKAVILGAGLSGLAAAEILSKYLDVEVFESDNEIGGLAGNFKKDNNYIPKYYHHIIKSNKNTLDYMNRFVGISPSKKNWKRINVAIAVDKNVCGINAPLQFLNFSYLNFYEKIRFGLFGLYTIFIMDPSRIKEGMNAKEWLEKKAGKNVTKKIFEHLYARNKFNIPLSRISAKQFAYRLNEKEVYDFFSFPKKGYQEMINGLAVSIFKNKGKIIKGAKIKSIDVEKKSILEGNKKVKYDFLISTIPFPEFLKIAKNLPEGLESNIEKIRYCPAVSICFATEDFLDKKNYWVNFFNERIHMLIQHSLLNDSYGEKINWCLRYGGSEKDMKLSDWEIKKEYLGVIKKYFPRAKIKWAKVIKTNYAEPIYDINYKEYMPPYKSNVDGLYFAGIQMTYPKIRNMDVALGSGRKAAEIVLGDLKCKK